VSVLVPIRPAPADHAPVDADIIRAAVNAFDTGRHYVLRHQVRLIVIGEGGRVTEASTMAGRTPLSRAN
jgi:hypothetical protein